jgi:hypothetical protein
MPEGVLTDVHRTYFSWNNSTVIAETRNHLRLWLQEKSLHFPAECDANDGLGVIEIKENPELICPIIP